MFFEEVHMRLSVSAVLDSNHMALQIVSDGEVFFQYGTKTEDDEKLLSAARALDGSCTVTLDGRSLYVGTERIRNTD